MRNKSIKFILLTNKHSAATESLRLRGATLEFYPSSNGQFHSQSFFSNTRLTELMRSKPVALAHDG